jgi:hypothetical protein
MKKKAIYLNSGEFPMKIVLPSLFVAAAIATQAGMASAKVAVPVVSGAKALSAVEKADVTGRCAQVCTPAPPPPCAPVPPAPTPSSKAKPGYGFGTTGHYGPPGQGFTPANNWRSHAAGDGLTPTGRPLPPRAFK